MTFSDVKSKATHAFTTKEGFFSMIKTKEGTKEREYGDQTRSNVDLDPTPFSDRNWGFWAFLLFEFSVSFSPTQYAVGATLINIGLPYYAIIISAFIVSAICAVIIWLNARGGAVYHIGFPVYVRIASGIRGSLFFIFIRGVVAILYMATQTLYASYLLAVCLRCIFGHRWTDIPNHLPKNAGITSSGLIAFMFYWLLQLPFAWIHPSKAAPLFAAKTFVSVPCLLICMIWALVAAGGPHWEKFQKQQITDPSLAAWAWMRAINSILSGTLPPLINIADLSRYADKPKNILPLSIGLFFSKPIGVLFGVLTTAAGNQLYGKAYWNQWDLYGAILTANWNAGARTLIFLLSFSQVYATLATNIASNSIPVGCDLAGLFPSFFTIRRGQILCSILALVVVPWKIVYSAASFLSFLGSYVCLITPIACCCMVDYWLIRKGNVHVPSLYKASPTSPYWYTYGFNWRAYAAWAIGVGLSISGIAGVLSPGSVAQVAVNMYNTSFLISGSSSALAFYLFNLAWPPMIYPAGPHDDDPKSFEYMRPSEGFFDEDERIGDIGSARAHARPELLEAVEADGPSDVSPRASEKDAKFV